MSNPEWLKSLKEGDVICIPGHGLTRGDYTEVKVIRKTPTGRIVVQTSNGTNIAFDKHGTHFADRWNISHLEPITAEMRKEKRKRRMLFRIEDTKFREMPYEQLEAVDKLLESFKEKVVDETAKG